MKARSFIENEELDELYQSVLFLSFSNAAVKRLKEAALAQLPRRMRSLMRIDTFHALTFEILCAHAHLVGVERPCRILRPHEKNRIENRLKEVEKNKTSRQKAILQELVDLESKGGLVYFDRFAPLAGKIFRSHTFLADSYSRAYPLILVDEYQDTDDDQDAFIRLLSRKSQLICLGDPNQRIYAWRGARPGRLKSLVRDHGHRPIHLRKNHRFRNDGIPAFAEAVLDGRTPKQTDCVTVIPHNRKTSNLRIPIARGLGEILKRVQKTSRSRIAIMARNNADVRTLSQLMSLPDKKGKAIRHTVLGDSADLGPAWDVVLGALELCSSSSGTETAFRGLAFSLAEFEACKARGGNKARRETLEKWADPERRIPNRGAGVQLLRLVGELRDHLSGDVAQDLAVLVDGLSKVSGSYLDGVLQALVMNDPRLQTEKLIIPMAEIWAESGSYAGVVDLGRRVLQQQMITDPMVERGGIVLMTMHKCKGREFDGVILVETKAGRFVNQNDHRHRARGTEDRLLFHTAITRAREQAVVLRLPFGKLLF